MARSTALATCRHPVFPDAWMLVSNWKLFNKQKYSSGQTKRSGTPHGPSQGCHPQPGCQAGLRPLDGALSHPAFLQALPSRFAARARQKQHLPQEAFPALSLPSVQLSSLLKQQNTFTKHRLHRRPQEQRPQSQNPDPITTWRDKFSGQAAESDSDPTLHPGMSCEVPKGPGAQ